MAEWISVEDEMPEQGERILVCDTAGNQFVTSHRRGFFIDYRVGDSYKEITHWQPLPEPPQ